MSSIDTNNNSNNNPEVRLAIYTVNCNGAHTVLLGGFGSSSRGTAGDGDNYDVLACQEIAADCKADGYDCIALYKDVEHSNKALNTGIFLWTPEKRNAPHWQKQNVGTYKLTKSRTGRGVAQVELKYPKNTGHVQPVAWIATVHCKSGQQYQKFAADELDELLTHVLDCGTNAGAQVIIVTGDMNWADVTTWAKKNEPKYKKTYNYDSHLGDDQLSGKSLMQTIVFYNSSLRSIQMKDMGRTNEGHAYLRAKLTF